MKYRFKAINYAENLNLFDRAYKTRDAAMQAAFAYMDLFVESDRAKEKLVGTVIDNFNRPFQSFTHNDTTFIIEPDFKELAM